MGISDWAYHRHFRSRRWISYYSCIGIICKTSNENCHRHIIGYNCYQFNFWVSIQFKTNTAGLEDPFTFHSTGNHGYLFRKSFSRKNFERDIEEIIWLVCVVNGGLYTYQRIIFKIISVEINCVQLITLYNKILNDEFY